jgi:GT2 family glycosyltransferase
MKIGIAIVHFGKQELLDNCRKSLEVSDINTFMPIIVHDCNVENIGFNKANNKLIKTLTSSDWIWLLNNDTIVPETTLKAIETILPTLDDKIGVIGFKILSMDNPDLIHHAGTIEAYPGGVHKSGSVRLRQFTERTNEKWVTFASVLIRREVFEEIGLLDEHMFNYYSDSDFCYRARYNGWKVIYEPNFIIHHKIGSSQNPNSEQIRMIQEDSIVFQNKWINGKNFMDLDKAIV